MQSIKNCNHPQSVFFLFVVTIPLTYVSFVQPSISETKKDSELLQKDLEKLKIILERYEARRDKLIDQIAMEKVELSKRSAKNNFLAFELF